MEKLIRDDLRENKREKELETEEERKQGEKERDFLRHPGPVSIPLEASWVP